MAALLSRMIVSLVAFLLFYGLNSALAEASNSTTTSTEQAIPPRYALVVALAGNKKLTEYFSWSCRTIFDSRDRFDLLVFHENNQLLRNVTCAENVKFYNLGEKGLSTEIVKTVLNTEDISNDAGQQLTKTVDSILQYIPTYLSELKPMMGAIFGRYLSSYRYWSYTDPDMIFGSLSQWITDEDLEQYHYYTLARNWDAARLFLRSQLTLHRNVPEVNALWQRLTYFQPQEFASRVGSISRAIMEAHEDKHATATPPTEAIARRFFHHPEGWYSKLVFEEGPGKVKIAGRVFDDFFREPVIRIRSATANGGTALLRCQQAMNLSHCIDHYYAKLQDPDEADHMKRMFSIAPLPSTQLKEVEVHIDRPEACKMAWLPLSTRSCIASEKFHHGSNHEANAVGKANNAEHKDELRLARVGECVLSEATSATSERVWYCNDEKAAPRQVHEAAAFFHFHHWDEFVAMSKAASTINDESFPSLPISHQVADQGAAGHAEHHMHVTSDCLVLYLRYDRALVLEACKAAANRERLLWTLNQKRLLLQHYVPATSILKAHGHEAPRPVPLSDSLALWRRKIEQGPTAKEDGDTEEDLLRRENRRNKQRVMKERERRQRKRDRQRSET